MRNPPVPCARMAAYKLATVQAGARAVRFLAVSLPGLVSGAFM